MEKEYLNFWQYAEKVLGYGLTAFEEGEGTFEEWELIIEILYKDSHVGDEH